MRSFIFLILILDYKNRLGMETVYKPAEDSFLMLEVLEGLLKTADRKQQTVLDMGTGSGVLAIAAAKKGCSVTAVDINPAAITLAKGNAKKEGVEMSFVVSNLFDNIKSKFDLILFNPPYVPTGPGEKRDMESAAWDGGKDGLVVITEFLKRAKGFLRPGGRILLLVASNSDKPPKLPGYATKLLKEKQLFFEKLFVLELSNKGR